MLSSNKEEEKKSEGSLRGAINRGSGISNQVLAMKRISCCCQCHSEGYFVSAHEMSVLKSFFDSGVMQQTIKFLQNAQFSSRMLTNLINDLLDLAKFETSTFKFNESYFNLIELVEQAFSQVKFSAN